MSMANEDSLLGSAARGQISGRKICADHGRSAPCICSFYVLHGYKNRAQS